MVPKLVDTDQKKKRIIRATLEVLAEKGVEGFKMVDIANTMDIGKSTIYEYFDSKQDLQEEALNFYLAEFFVFSKEEELTIFEFIEKSLNQLTKFTEEEQRLFQVAVDIWYQAIKGDFSQIESIYTSYKEYTAQKIKEGQKGGIVRKDIDPEATAGWLIGVLDGLGLQVLMDLKEFEQEKILNSFLQTIKYYLQVDN